MNAMLDIQGVSKKFSIQRQEPYLTLRDRIVNLLEPSLVREDFWALKDISLEIKPGDSLGIIGRNGAGKSTLLKILSKITPPTAGRILCRGRIASLLEVGTGFHPELSGRENIFLNGSILGMKRREIVSRFDAIVDFAGTEKFLDTPLKHYSSGMQLRLAFSVAAHLDPEILVIDEVLAVGDAEFQKRCLGKMEEVTKSGRTILFVSHNMAAIERLCQRTVLLKAGTVDAIGPSSQIAQLYLKNPEVVSPSDQSFPRTKRKAQIDRLEFLSHDIHTDTVFMGGDLQVKLHFFSSYPLDNPMLGIVLNDALGSPLLFFNTRNYGVSFGKGISEGIMQMQIKELNLMPGFYSLDIYFADFAEDLDVKKDCFTFQVVYKHFEGAGEPLNERFNRIFYKDVEWKLLSKGQ